MTTQTTTKTRSREDVLRQMFGVIDERDASGAVQFLSEDVEMLFGAPEPMRGRAAVQSGLTGFFETIAGVRHDIRKIWSGDEGAAVEADVVYTRIDGSQVMVPAVTVCRFDDDERVQNYRVYIDLAPLQAG